MATPLDLQNAAAAAISARADADTAFAALNTAIEAANGDVTAELDALNTAQTNYARAFASAGAAHGVPALEAANNAASSAAQSADDTLTAVTREFLGLS